MTTTQKSVILLEKFGQFEVQETDIPKPGPGELLVEIRSTALNPRDWKIPLYGILIDTYPAVLGMDSAGIVKEVGEGVTEFTVGDRVYVLNYDALFARFDKLLRFSGCMRVSSTTETRRSSSIQSFQPR